jgi:hypothetical protein
MQVARLCDSCGFGSRQEECLKCGEEASHGGVIAPLCASCSSSAGDKCIKCGKPISAVSVTALLCGRCGVHPDGKRCSRCGRYLDRAAATA